MRWLHAAALILIGALIGGAYFLSTDQASVVLSQDAVHRSQHDTHHVIIHHAYLRRLVAAIGVAALIYGAIQWLGPRRLHIFAAASVILWCLGVSITLAPQHLLGRPRRYVDYPDAFATWHFVSTLGSALALFGAALLLGLLTAALVLRFRSRGN